MLVIMLKLPYWYVLIYAAWHFRRKFLSCCWGCPWILQKENIGDGAVYWVEMLELKITVHLKQETVTDYLVIRRCCMSYFLMLCKSFGGSLLVTLMHRLIGYWCKCWLHVLNVVAKKKCTLASCCRFPLNFINSKTVFVKSLPCAQVG